MQIGTVLIVAISCQAQRQNQKSFREQELILMKTLGEKLKQCNCEETVQDHHNQQCTCCWSTGCLCPMPPRVLKIKKSFLEVLDQKHDLMYRFIQLPNRANDYKKVIQELRWRKRFILENGAKNLKERNCEKCEPLAKTCNAERRRGWTIAKSFGGQVDFYEYATRPRKLQEGVIPDWAAEPLSTATTTTTSTTTTLKYRTSTTTLAPVTTTTTTSTSTATTSITTQTTIITTTRTSTIVTTTTKRRHYTKFLKKFELTATTKQYQNQKTTVSPESIKASTSTKQAIIAAKARMNNLLSSSCILFYNF